MKDWNARREDWKPQDEDARDVGDVDYARVIHSASFRRLQGKTQVLNLGDSDFLSHPSDPFAGGRPDRRRPGAATRAKLPETSCDWNSARPQPDPRYLLRS